MKRVSYLAVIVLLGSLLSACATPQNNHDPIEPVNRVTDKVNDNIDRVTLKPLAQGYTAAVPKPMRTAVSNFYDNATYMNTVLNDFLQGKGEQGIRDFIRFLINTTLGAGGLVDVATSMGLERHEEDFGQTLGVWGMSQGAYIVYPLLGPNSARKTPDFISATATDPLFWASFFVAPYVTIPLAALKYVDKRAQLLDASDMRDELALDPYVFTREAYFQHREYETYDGNPPKKKKIDDDGWEEVDFDSPSIKTKIHLEDTPPADELPPAPAAESVEVAMQSAEQAVVEPETPAPAAGASVEDQAISAEQPAAQSKHYVINLSSHYSEVEAAAEQGRLARLGVETEIWPVSIDNRTWYRLRSVERLGKEQARERLQSLRELTGLTGIWLEPAEH